MSAVGAAVPRLMSVSGSSRIWPVLGTLMCCGSVTTACRYTCWTGPLFLATTAGSVFGRWWCYEAQVDYF
jgi:hypothetical protein